MTKDHKKNKKQRIPKKLRESVWLHHNGKEYEVACYCCEENMITPFQFECGHIVAEAKGGKLNVRNLVPICGNCNRSMGTKNLYEFKRLCGYEKDIGCFRRIFRLFTYGRHG